MPSRRHQQNSGTRSAPPWPAYAQQPVDLDLIFWTEIQGLKGDLDDFREETREEMSDLKREVERHGRLWRNLKTTTSFCWTHAGQFFKLAGWMLFAATGVTGQWPRLLDLAASWVGK